MSVGTDLFTSFSTFKTTAAELSALDLINQDALLSLHQCWPWVHLVSDGYQNLQ